MQRRAGHQGTGTGHIVLDEPVPSGAVNTSTVTLPVGNPGKTGSYPLELTVDRVNGEEVTNSGRTATGRLNVVPVIPVNRPLVEEYTGLGCQYCPRGYVTLEQMKAQHGEDFVALAYHSQSYESQIVTVFDRDFPIALEGFPAAAVNRSSQIDPAQIPMRWETARQGMPAAALTSTLSYFEKEGLLKGEASVVFAKDIDGGDYRISLALVADNLHNESWAQQNAFAGEEHTGPFWDLFTKGKRTVFGLTFNDVVVKYTDINSFFFLLITLSLKSLNRKRWHISFSDYLRTVAGLSEPVVLEAVDATREVHFRNRELLIEEGKVCKRIFFINSGTVRCFSLFDGKEYIRSFSMEWDNVLSTLSLTHGLPSVFSVEAIGDVTATEYTAGDYNRLVMSNPEQMRFTIQALYACLNILEVGSSLHASRTPPTAICVSSVRRHARW